jgi:hypothetical protein
LPSNSSSLTLTLTLALSFTLASCERGGEVLTAQPPTFFISPLGADENPGTEALPWQTFAHALPRLRPGYSLVLLDGTYESQTTGFLQVECGANAEVGTATLPIIVRAQHDRRAFLKGDGSGIPVVVSGCAHWVIEGLHAEGVDLATEPNDTGEGGSLFVITGASHDIVVRRALAARANRYFEASVYLISPGVSDVLIEDSEAYDFHYYGFHTYQASRVTLRRDYVNSRGWADLPDGYVTSYPAEGDGAFLLTMSWDCIVENSIAESVAKGFTVSGDRTATSGDHPPVRNQFLGDVAITTSHAGYDMDSRCGDEAPCATGDRIVADTRLVDDVAWGGQWGFYSEGAVDTVIENASVFEATDAGIYFNREDENAGLGSTSFARASLVSASASAAVGFRSAAQDDWQLASCNTFGAAVAFDPQDTHVVDATETDPRLAGCLVYLPPASPLKRAGKGDVAGRDIGANLIYRYEGGRLTTRKLWDPTTGLFPCGALVAGVNDISRADVSCIGVSGRLHVGASGCAVP